MTPSNVSPVVTKRQSAMTSLRARASGGCQDTRRSNRPCATAISTHSVSPESMSLPKPNPVEPPWYVTRMPGGVGGWHREMSPYPDL
jgi:hypothetical protein